MLECIRATGSNKCAACEGAAVVVIRTKRDKVSTRGLGTGEAYLRLCLSHASALRQRMSFVLAGQDQELREQLA